jgi:hypothetical protein
MDTDFQICVDCRALLRNAGVNLKIAPVPERIEPVQSKRRHDCSSQESRLRVSKRNTHTRRTRHKHDERVKIKHDYRAKHGEHERIPFDRREKMALEELNPAPRHAARDARQAGNRVKDASRPRQTNC